MKANLQKLTAIGLCFTLTVAALTGCGEDQSGKEVRDIGSATGSAVTEGGSATGSAVTGGRTATGSDEEGNRSGARKKHSGPKKTFDNLDGMDIKIADWFTDKASLAERTDKFGKAQNNYWESIQDKYNFTISRDALYSYTDAQSDYVNDVMANDPKFDLYYLYSDFVSEPLLKGLMYNLATLPELDFSEEKWSPSVYERMSIGDGIWGMNPDSEPRGGIFYNKRLFKEAGIDPEEPYELQKDNQWTWDKFEEYCKKLTKDTNGDGKTDQYAMASFSQIYLPLCAANNNAAFVTRGEDGKYKSGINTTEFRDAINWGVDLIEKGYIAKRYEGAAWDHHVAIFRDGEAAMLTAEVYQITTFITMEDEWGFVMFPYNENNKEAVNKTIPDDNIVVMPACFRADRAEKVAFAYDLYTEPVKGYTAEDEILEQYYPVFRDERAVDETIHRMLEEKHQQVSYLPLIRGLDLGDFCDPVYKRMETPVKKIEGLSTKWDRKISKFNKEAESINEDYMKSIR